MYLSIGIGLWRCIKKTLGQQQEPIKNLTRPQRWDWVLNQSCAIPAPHIFFCIYNWYIWSCCEPAEKNWPAIKLALFLIKSDKGVQVHRTLWEMFFLPAELAKEARNEVLTHWMGGWVRVRISDVTFGHVIQFLFLAIRSNSFPTLLAPCQSVSEFGLS